MISNHRVVKKAGFYAIHEVYYDDNDQPYMVTEDAETPMGVSLEELREDLEWFTKALSQPVLKYEDIIKRGDKND